MSVSPTTGMSRLSVSMPPTTRSQAAMPSPGIASLFEEDGSVVRLPSELKYNVSNVSERTQDIVRALPHRSPAEYREFPPELVLRTCGKYQQKEDWYYTFEILEVVPYSIRIGSPDSHDYATPKCHGPHSEDHHKLDRRPDDKGKSKEPKDHAVCKHMVFLMDWIAKHTLPDHPPDEELTMTENGWAAELGAPFQAISDVQLGILADDFHCNISLPDAETLVSQNRILEAQEILAEIAGDTVDQVKRQLGLAYDTDQLIYRGDPLTTLYSLMLASHHLTALIRSQLDPSDPPLDPYLALQRKVTRIVSELDLYGDSLLNMRQMANEDRETSEVKHPLDSGSPNVAWAAEQIQRCVRGIEAILSRNDELADWERDSAVKSLVRILRTVVDHNRDSFPGYPNQEISKDDRNLYARLIGNHDNDFVYSALSLLDDQTDYIADLENIMDIIENLDYGSKVSYNTKMRGLIARMRSNVSRRPSRSTIEHFSPAQGSPPLGPPPRRFAGSSTSHAQMPSVPSASPKREGQSTRRGSSAGAGSKRTGSGIGDRDSKRAR